MILLNSSTCEKKMKKGMTVVCFQVGEKKSGSVFEPTIHCMKPKHFFF